MRKILLTLTVLAKAGLSHAQSCDNLYYFDQEKASVLTIYNEKGEVTGAYSNKASAIQTTGSGIKALLHTTRTDKTGAITEETTDTVKCGQGDFYLLLGTERSWTAQPVYLRYPATMQEGQALEREIAFVAKKTERGKRVMQKLKISNRKVAGMEKITIPSGSRNCYRMTYNLTFPYKIMGIGMPVDLKITEWFAPGLGVLRSEIRYDNKLVEYYVLTSPLQ